VGQARYAVQVVREVQHAGGAYLVVPVGVRGEGFWFGRA
jgi:hypothetical protein